MKSLFRSRLASLVVTCLLGMLVAPGLVQATPIIGDVNIVGLVRVTATTIDWYPLGGGFGFSTSIGSVVAPNYFAPLIPGTPGLVFDLDATLQPVGVPFSMPLFLTFPTAMPGVDFTLTFIETATVNPPFPGSPFNMSQSGGNTTVTINMRGTVTDSANPGEWSYWSGSWSADFTGKTIAMVLAELATVGYVEAPYSANIVANAIPEPASLSLIGFGLIGAGLLRRRFRA